jgi:hypothetical protein
MVFGQSLKKYPIGNTACSAYFYCNPGTANVSYSEDSSAVYQLQCDTAQLRYGLVCVALKEAITELVVAQDLMISYMDYLKTTFNIKQAAGYGKNNSKASDPKLIGVVDFWKDDQQRDWQVRGWTDGHYIAVLYAAGAAATVNENTSKISVFLNGFQVKR